MWLSHYCFTLRTFPDLGIHHRELLGKPNIMLEISCDGLVSHQRRSGNYTPTFYNVLLLFETEIGPLAWFNNTNILLGSSTHPDSFQEGPFGQLHLVYCVVSNFCIFSRPQMSRSRRKLIVFWSRFVVLTLTVARNSLCPISRNCRKSYSRLWLRQALLQKR